MLLIQILFSPNTWLRSMQKLMVGGRLLILVDLQLMRGKTTWQSLLVSWKWKKFSNGLRSLGSWSSRLYSQIKSYILLFQTSSSELALFSKIKILQVFHLHDARRILELLPPTLNHLDKLLCCPSKTGHFSVKSVDRSLVGQRSNDRLRVSFKSGWKIPLAPRLLFLAGEYLGIHN